MRDNPIEIPSHGVAPGVTGAGRPVYERKGSPDPRVSLNVRRRGQVQASEGLAVRDPHLLDELQQGFAYGRAQTSSDHWIEAKFAEGRSPLADWDESRAAPAWAQPDPAMRFDFNHAGLEAAEGIGRGIPAQTQRSTPATFTDMSRVSLEERPRTSYARVLGSDVKQIRHNNAEVND